jgi:periplasmic protein CpxP/Spy
MPVLFRPVTPELFPGLRVRIGSGRKSSYALGAPRLVPKELVPKENEQMSKFAIVLAGALLASCTALAQDSAQTPPAAGTTSAPAHAKHSGTHPDRAEQRLKRLSKKVNLTDDQKEKVRPILQNEEKQTADLDNDSALTPQQKHKKTREIRMASRSQIDEILTPEQKEKLPSRRANTGGHHHQKPGAPAQTGSDQTSQQ